MHTSHDINKNQADHQADKSFSNQILENEKFENWALSPEQRAVLAEGRQSKESDTVIADLGKHKLLIHIEGVLDTQRLQTALAQVVAQHAVLRHAFRVLPGYRGLRQQELPATAAAAVIKWQIEEAFVDNSDATKISLDDHLSTLQQTKFNLSVGQNIQALLIRTGEQSWTLALSLAALVADESSLIVLYQALISFYTADDLNQKSDEEVFQYAHYVEWRQDLESDEDALEHVSYWKEHIKGVESNAIPFLSYRKDYSEQLSSGKKAFIRRQAIQQPLENALHQELIKLAASSNTTVETIFQFAWWVLLAKIRGDYRLIGGWQNDCRHDYEPMQGAIGVYDKVLPVVINIGSETSFLSSLQEFSSLLDAHRSAQEYWSVDHPLSTLHRNIGFTYTDIAQLETNYPLWHLGTYPKPMRCFELALQISRKNDSFQVAIHFDTDHYSTQAIEVLTGQYLILLKHMIQQPETSIDALSLLDQDIAPLVGHFSEHKVGEHSIAWHIAQWAIETPEASALEVDGDILTYSQLETKVSQLTYWLHELGIKNGDLIALNLDRSVDFITTLLASWRLGAAYLPLDTQWPLARCQAILNDAQPALVLHSVSSQKNWLLEASNQDKEIGPLHRVLEHSVIEEQTNALTLLSEHEDASLSNIAYVLYTSGSTGLPKGVMIEHRQLLNYVTSVSEVLNFNSNQRWALTASIAADLGNTALFGALFNGGSLVIATIENMQDADSFAQFMRKNAIDSLKIVPSHLEALLECENPTLPRTLILGGEATPRALVERILQLAPECQIFNHYGPTETTVGVMVHAANTTNIMTESALPLSNALANCRIYVLDEQQQPVPFGSLGEVYVGGAQVCRGYINCTNDETFLSDPQLPDQKLYRTGDLAWLLPDSTLLLAGRADHQLKIRGFRIEPGEIEGALTALPGIRQVVVIPFQPRNSSQTAVELRAFIVLNTLPKHDDERSIRDSLQITLPSHMIPGHYTFLEALPRLLNGKIDRKACEAIPLEQVSQRVWLPPRNAIEFLVTDVMAQLLGQEKIGIDEDFFELGGHSLLVIKLAARIRKLLKVEIAPGLIFDHANAAALAALIRTTATDPVMLEKIAEAQRKLAQMSPQEREALLERAGQANKQVAEANHSNKTVAIPIESPMSA